MLRSTLARTLMWVAGFVREPLTLAELKSWCRRASAGFARSWRTGELAPLQCPTAELARIRELSGQLFPQENLDWPSIPGTGDQTVDLSAARNWMAVWRESTGSLAGGLPQRFGFLLDALDQVDEAPPGVFEKLLIHIEVKRAQCLSGWQKDRQSDIACERLAVAICLFRAAARRRDLRLLNAGLKLFDWFGAPELDRSERLPWPTRTRLLLAALEGTACIVELLAE